MQKRSKAPQGQPSTGETFLALFPKRFPRLSCCTFQKRFARLWGCLRKGFPVSAIAPKGCPATIFIIPQYRGNLFRHQQRGNLSIAPVPGKPLGHHADGETFLAAVPGKPFGVLATGKPFENLVGRALYCFVLCTALCFVLLCSLYIYILVIRWLLVRL